MNMEGVVQILFGFPNYGCYVSTSGLCSLSFMMCPNDSLKLACDGVVQKPFWIQARVYGFQVKDWLFQLEVAFRSCIAG